MISDRFFPQTKTVGADGHERERGGALKEERIERQRRGEGVEGGTECRTQ